MSSNLTCNFNNEYNDRVDDEPYRYVPKMQGRRDPTNATARSPQQYRGDIGFTAKTATYPTRNVENEYINMEDLKNQHHHPSQSGRRLPDIEEKKVHETNNANSRWKCYSALLLCILFLICFTAGNVAIWLLMGKNPACNTSTQLDYNTVWKLQAQNVCYKTKGNGFGVINLKEEGQITGIKLEHVSGNLTCNISASNRGNLWGCNYGTKPSTTNVLTVITDANNEVVFPANIGSSKAFTVPGFNALMSHVLVFTNYAYPNYFDEGQELRVWHIEDLFNFRSEPNSGGIHCVNVYATFQKNIYK